MTGKEIQANGFNWCFAEELVNGQPGKITIVNTDTGSPGIHWLCVAQLRGSIRYVFDPLGPRNRRVNSMGQSTDKYIKNARTYFYPHACQIKSSTDCGLFSMHVGKRIRAAFSENPDVGPKDIDRIIEKDFGYTADKGDERKVEKEFGL